MRYRMKAFAWANGVIGIDEDAPEGSLVFAEGTEGDLHRAVADTARLAYDGKTWLVPGVPESEGDAAVDALLAYQREVERRLK